MKLINFLIFMFAIYLFSSCGESHDILNTPNFSGEFRTGKQCQDTLAAINIDGGGERSTYFFKQVAKDTINGVILYDICFRHTVITQSLENEVFGVFGKNYADKVVLTLKKGTFEYPYNGHPTCLTIPKTEDKIGKFKKICN